MPFVLSVKRLFSPLDEELELVPGRLTPRLQEHLTRLSTWMPFARAVKELQAFSGVSVTEPTARRTAQAAGAAYVEHQTAQVEALERTTPEAPSGPPLQLLSVDGALVPLVHAKWTEVKTVVVGTIQPPVIENGEPVVHSTDLSYFSRLSEAETFGQEALVETHRRGVERAGRVIAVTDGAVWEQGFIDVHRHDAVRILDFPHATEYLTQAGQVVYGEATPELKTWLADTCHELKHGAPDTVLNALRTLHQTAQERHLAQAELIQGSLDYLEKRRPLLAYAQFQAAGYPIGSGAVESGNKVVVEARLKGAGMHWAPRQVNPMLALRNIACSDRWAEAWPEIERQRRQQARLRRERRQVAHRTAHAKPADADAVASLPEPPAIPTPKPSTKASARKVSGQPYVPAANHPWRHSPIGRARFQPSRRSGDAKL